MQKKFLLLFLLSFFISIFSACQKAETKSPSGAPSADAKRVDFRGKVISVDKAKKEATIQHEDVPDLQMPGMTMPFPIKEDWVMDTLAPGEEIRADLVVDKGEYYLENIGIVALPNPDQPPLPVNDAEKDLIGKELPDFKLTNQDGKHISTRDFRGKALAITFIYTRCPLPDACLLMTIHFSEMAMNLTKDPDLKDKVRLLSITFDPKYDTPQVLKTYGAGYYNKDTKPDFTLWQLATGSEDDIQKIADFFGLLYQPSPDDKTQIIHSLRTAVIDPQGKVRKVFSGNGWTNDQVLKELKDSLAAENK